MDFFRYSSCERSRRQLIAPRDSPWKCTESLIRRNARNVPGGASGRDDAFAFRDTLIDIVSNRWENEETSLREPPVEFLERSKT